MNKALLNSLTVAERRFLDATSPHNLRDLDEEQALDLHARARRTRDKYVQSYRRAASAAVAERGGRGLSYEENQRDRGKAEAFEVALARVSRRLGVLAARSAARLRAERLEAARSRRAEPPEAEPAQPSSVARAEVPPATKPRGAKKTTGGLKRDASSRSMGARRQAKRDAR